MAILKYNDGKEWKALYGNDIKNKLDKNKNLSDLTNRLEARQNLELTGNNNHTHYHDDRYIPLINKIKEDVNESQENASNSLNEQIANIKTYINNSINDMNKNLGNKIDALIKKEQNERNEAINNMMLQLKQEDQKIMNSIEEIKNQYLKLVDVSNNPNKVPRFSKEGHLILPSGLELW